MKKTTTLKTGWPSKNEFKASGKNRYNNPPTLQKPVSPAKPKGK